MSAFDPPLGFYSNLAYTKHLNDTILAASRHKRDWTKRPPIHIKQMNPPVGYFDQLRHEMGLDLLTYNVHRGVVGENEMALSTPPQLVPRIPEKLTKGFESFGDIKISRPELKLNTVALRYPNGISITGYPLRHVSNAFVKLLMQVLDRDELNDKIYSELSSDEEQFFNSIMRLAGLTGMLVPIDQQIHEVTGEEEEPPLTEADRQMLRDMMQKREDEATQELPKPRPELERYSDPYAIQYTPTRPIPYEPSAPHHTRGREQGILEMFPSIAEAAPFAPIEPIIPLAPTEKPSKAKAKRDRIKAAKAKFEEEHPELEEPYGETQETQESLARSRRAFQPTEEGRGFGTHKKRKTLGLKAKRVRILKGEIGAGQDNPLVFRELNRLTKRR